MSNIDFDLATALSSYGLSYDTKFYHGGVPYKSTGQYLLCPEVTGVLSSASFAPLGFSSGALARRDRVYVTTKIQDAILFSSFHPSGHGMVYECIPEGCLDDDPDCQVTAEAFECERALIVRRVRVKASTRRKLRRLAEKWTRASGDGA